MGQSWAHRHPAARVAWASAGMASVVLALLSGELARAAEERDIEAQIAINDALDPVLRLLSQFTADPTADPSANGRDRLAAQAVTLVLATAPEFIGPQRARAGWFRFEPSPPVRLLAREHAGRAGAPTTVFTAGTAAGDAAIDLVPRRGVLRCTDVAIDPPPGGSLDPDFAYRTFLIDRVSDDNAVFAMLTLEALEAGSLSPDDLDLLYLMARSLALPLGLRVGQAGGPVTEEAMAIKVEPLSEDERVQ